MPFEYDVTTDLRFIQGKEVGIDKGIGIGIEQGIVLGKDEGKIEGKIEVILNGYPNGITISMLSNITNFSETQVIQILKDNNLM